MDEVTTENEHVDIVLDLLRKLEEQQTCVACGTSPKRQHSLRDHPRLLTYMVAATSEINTVGPKRAPLLSFFAGSVTPSVVFSKGLIFSLLLTMTKEAMVEPTFDRFSSSMSTGVFLGR